MAHNKKSFKKKTFFSFFKESIPGGIFAISAASMLINMSTSAVFASVALYMKTILGATIATIGLLEAITEAVSYAIRLFSGYLSDYTRKRKPIILLGFILITISKPLLAFSNTVHSMFLANTIDRMGNGTQASPRDALVGDLAPAKLKGSCYGLRQSFATVGSVIGGILGIIVLKMSCNDFKLLFSLLSIPAVIAVLLILFFVKDKNADGKASQKSSKKIKISDLKLLGNKFWMLMAVVFLYMLGRFSEIFIALHANSNHGLGVGYGTLVTVIFNLTASFIAFPMGRLSDKVERTTILIFGILSLMTAHLIIYSAPNLYVIFIGILIWGLQYGINQSIVATLVADYVPKGLRGTGFGVYYFIIAISTATANSLAGYTAQKSGTEAMAFLSGAIFCACALTVLLIFKKKMRRTESEIEAE